MEYQSLGTEASFPLTACADWDDEIKWETAACCWCCHITPKHEWQHDYVQRTRYKAMDRLTQFFEWAQHLQRPTVSGAFVLPSGRKVYINICFVTGTHWPQELQLLLWHVLWYRWFSACFDWPSDNSLLWCICTCCESVSWQSTCVLQYFLQARFRPGSGICLQHKTSTKI